MTQFLTLTKINVLNIFDFKKLKNSKKQTKSILLVIGIAALYLMMLGYVGIYAYVLGKNGMYDILLPMGFVMCSLMNLFTTVYKSGGLLFTSNDYDLLMAMPISTKIVVLSKLVTLYIMDLLFVIATMVPIYCVYVFYAGFDIMTLVYYVITLFFIPVVPLALGTLLGFVVTFISQRFKRTNIFNILFSFVGIIALYAFIFSRDNSSVGNSEIILVNMMDAMMGMFNQYYPLTQYYANVLIANSVTDLLIFLGISLVIGYITVYLISTQFIKMNIISRSRGGLSNYKMTSLKSNSVFKALYIKEFKKYISSSTYVVNTAIGCVITLFFAVYLAVFPSQAIEMIFQVEAGRDMIVGLAPFMLSLFTVLCCTTATSISNEAQQLWLIKSMPINKMDIYKAKIALNLSITFPSILISGILLIYALNASFIEGLVIILFPLVVSGSQAVNGLVFNINHPKYDWTNELQLYKQSLSVFVMMFSYMLMIMVALSLTFVAGNSLIITVIMGLLFLVTGIISYMRLNKLEIKTNE